MKITPFTSYIAGFYIQGLDKWLKPIKYLLHKHDKQSLGPQHPRKSQTSSYQVQRWQRANKQIPIAHWPASVGESMSARFSDSFSYLHENIHHT